MKVLFVDTVHPILEERLKAHGHECIDGTSSDLNTCRKLAEDADGIVIRSRFRMDSSFLEGSPNLKFIARSGAGMENIDEVYCLSKGIRLYNAPEGNRNAVAEHALAMILSLFNKIIPADREVRNGVWDREGNRGIELDGKTIGIIGYGNNGSAFGRKLRGFDVKVLAYDKYKTGISENNVVESSLNELFEEADVVSFHIPQNDETLFMADREFFNSFRKPIYLINLSRGKIVKTQDLVAAMKNGKVMGACLDVLEYESSSFEDFFAEEIPEDLNYLLQSDQVVLSPHVGGWTNESYFKLSDVLAEKILSEFPESSNS